MSTVLFVCSRFAARAPIVEGLRSQGFRVVQADDESSALLAIRAHAPSVVLYDVRGSADGGAEFCRQARASYGLPVIALSTEPNEIEELLVFAAGAEDYLPWSTSVRVLAARLRVVERRYEHHRSVRVPTSDELRHGSLRLTRSSRQVVVGDSQVHLTRTEFDLLAHLLEAPRVVFARDELLRRVWGHAHGDTHVIEVHVSRLRAKILAAGGPPVIEAIRGVGYRLTGSNPGDGLGVPRCGRSICEPGGRFAATG